MSVLLFIGSIVWGSLAALFLVQTISSLISAGIHLYSLSFSRVKNELNTIFFATALTQAVLFAALLVGGFWLIGWYVELWNANWTAGSVAFVLTFIYCAIQVPNNVAIDVEVALKKASR
jgi:hypothetical protein